MLLRACLVWVSFERMPRAEVKKKVKLVGLKS
jgi:hypothetical protein